MLWWNILSDDHKQQHTQKVFKGREPHSLTGREIEMVYEEMKRQVLCKRIVSKLSQDTPYETLLKVAVTIGVQLDEEEKKQGPYIVK